MNIRMLGDTVSDLAASNAYLADLAVPAKYSNEQLLAIVNGPEFATMYAASWELGIGQEYADFQRMVQMHSLAMAATVAEVDAQIAASKPKLPYGLLAAGAAAYFFLK